MPLISDALSATRAIQALLQAYLDAHFDPKDGAAHVTLQDEYQSVGGPIVTLERETDADSEYSLFTRPMRRQTLKAVCSATPFSGAIVGVENPLASDSRLVAELQEAVADAAFYEAGFVMPEIQIGRKTVEERDEGLRENECRLTVHYFTPLAGQETP